MNTEQIEQTRSLRPMIRLGPLALYMLIFFIIPIGVFFIYSFWSVRQWNIVHDWNIKNYIEVATSVVYIRLIFRSIWIGLATAILSVLVVYPLAYTMVFKFEKYRDLILFVLAISLFSDYLVRIYAWRSILSSNGFVNYLAMQVGLAKEPTFYLLYSQRAVILILLNLYIPFATLPIYSALLNVQRDLIEAASDLGAGPFRAFREITLPLSMPGVVVAFLFIFLLSAGDFVTPELVGGRAGMMIGNAIATQFGMVSNWPLGSAMAFTTIGTFVFLIAVGLLLRRAFPKARRMANDQDTK